MIKRYILLSLLLCAGMQTSTYAMDAQVVDKEEIEKAKVKKLIEELPQEILIIILSFEFDNYPGTDQFYELFTKKRLVSKEWKTAVDKLLSIKDLYTPEIFVRKKFLVLPKYNNEKQNFVETLRKTSPPMTIAVLQESFYNDNTTSSFKRCSTSVYLFFTKALIKTIYERSDHKEAFTFVDTINTEWWNGKKKEIIENFKTIRRHYAMPAVTIVVCSLGTAFYEVINRIPNEKNILIMSILKHLATVLSPAWIIKYPASLLGLKTLERYSSYITSLCAVGITIYFKTTASTKHNIERLVSNVRSYIKNWLFNGEDL